MPTDIAQQFYAAPPVSRTIVASMFALSVLVHGGLMSGSRVIFHPRFIFKLPPEIWRVASSFLLTGGGFSFFFDLYFTWTYATGLELNSPRFTIAGDFFIYVLFVASIILVLAGFVFGAMVFTHPLILAFVYTFAQDNQGKKAHFILFQIPIELLPWAMLLLTLLMGGPTAAMMDGTGIVAAHLYDFLTRLYPTFQGGTNYIRTPAAVRRLFGSEQTQRTSKGYGQAIRPGQASQQDQSRGWSTGFSNTWVGRGSGRRLGGD